MNISQLQSQLESIFGQRNSTRSLTEVCLLLLASFGHLNKAVRTGNNEVIKFQSASVFAWMCALSSKLSLSLEEIFWSHFPGVCPYCACRVCDSTKHLVPKARRDVSGFASRSSPGSIGELQTIMQMIYPGNQLIGSASHLVEEIAEVAAAITSFQETRSAKAVLELKLELADCLAHLFAVANCAHFDLEDSVKIFYANGCRSCGRPVCVCRVTEFGVHSQPA
jgi:NTP pyrophosphatase (non-canonical NTP hydrolase)